MNRRAFITTAAAGALGSVLAPARAAAAIPDYELIKKIRAEGLGRNSKAMADASYFMDVLGPRLTGGPNIRKAGDWMIAKFKEYGLANAALEAWPNDPTGSNNSFAKGWANTKFYMQALTPTPFPISGLALAWTPGTNGVVSGECIMVPELQERDLKSRYEGKLKGKWVLSQPAGELRSYWEPVARRYTAEQLAQMETPARGPETGTPQPQRVVPVPNPDPRPNPGDGPRFDRFEWFKQQGALGVFQTNKGQGAYNVQGGNRLRPDEAPTRVAIMAEQYGRIARALAFGQTVTIEADIQNEWTDKPPMFNVVGEIRGKEKPDDVVMIGAHFDSWHASTGATDNGCNCIAALEAMRILVATGTPLKRTVRIGLWTGEEQGIIGSRLYVAQHFGGVRGAPSANEPRGPIIPFTKDHAKFQGYFNLDNGGGQIRGVYLQNNGAMAPIFREWFEPFRDLGATTVNYGNTGGTDHLSFDAAGLPGFQFIQDPIDYEPKTHHTNLDFYESLSPEDMRRNSTMWAGFAMMAANHPERLPRKPYEPPREGPPQPPMDRRPGEIRE